MILSMSLILSITISMVYGQTSFTSLDIDELRIAAMDLFDTFGNSVDGPEFKPLIGSVIRLVFHDCAGAFHSENGIIDNTLRVCDGCIDFNNGAHGGLKEFAVDPIMALCQQFSDRINRADCWPAIGL